MTRRGWGAWWIVGWVIAAWLGLGCSGPAEQKDGSASATASAVESSAASPSAPTANGLAGTTSTAAATLPPCASTRCSGAERWSRRFAGGGEARVTGLATSADGGTVAAGIFVHDLARDGTGRAGAQIEGRDPIYRPNPDGVGRHDSFVARVTADGALEPITTLGGGGDQTIYALRASLDGDLAVSGSFGRPLELGGEPLFSESPPSVRAFGLLLDARGKKKVAATGPGPAGSVGLAIAPDGRGGLWLGGSSGLPVTCDLFLKHVNASGETTVDWSDSSGGCLIRDLVPLPDGHVLVVGSYRIMLSKGEPIFTDGEGEFLLELDGRGAVVRKAKLGRRLQVQHAAVDVHGRVYFTAAATDPATLLDAPISPGPSGLLVALDADWRLRFSARFSPWYVSDRTDMMMTLYGKYMPYFTGVWENGALLALDPAGDPVVAVTFQGRFEAGAVRYTSSVARDVAILHFDAEDGHVVWSRQVGGPPKVGQLAHALSVDATGCVTVGGSYIDHPDAFLTRAER